MQSGIPFHEAGMLVADGNGHITSGKDDFAIGYLHFFRQLHRHVSSEWRWYGLCSAEFCQAAKLDFRAYSLRSRRSSTWLRSDFATSASGTGQKQDATAFSSVPSGTFVLRMHTLNSSQALASKLGAFTVAAVQLQETGQQNRTSFGFDVSQDFNFPDATTGRGSGTFTDGCCHFNISSITLLTPTI